MGKRGPKPERVLFVDAEFLEDPKIVALTTAEKVEWLRVLLDHVRYGNGSELPAHVYGVSKGRVRKFLELGLVDDVGGSLHIHGWDSWNGRDAYKKFLNRERVRRFREAQRREM